MRANGMKDLLAAYSNQRGKQGSAASLGSPRTVARGEMMNAISIEARENHRAPRPGGDGYRGA